MPDLIAARAAAERCVHDWESHGKPRQTEPEMECFGEPNDVVFARALLSLLDNPASHAAELTKPLIVIEDHDDSRYFQAIRTPFGYYQIYDDGSWVLNGKNNSGTGGPAACRADFVARMAAGMRGAK